MAFGSPFQPAWLPVDALYGRLELDMPVLFTMSLVVNGKKHVTLFVLTGGSPKLQLIENGHTKCTIMSKARVKSRKNKGGK